MKWAEDVACRGNLRNAHEIWLESLNGTDNLKTWAQMGIILKWI
jgi:hypothetical protein